MLRVKTSKINATFFYFFLTEIVLKTTISQFSCYQIPTVKCFIKFKIIRGFITSYEVTRVGDLSSIWAIDNYREPDVLDFVSRWLFTSSALESSLNIFLSFLNLYFPCLFIRNLSNLIFKSNMANVLRSF